MRKFFCYFSPLLITTLLMMLPIPARGQSLAPTPPFNQCPPVGKSASCAILIVIDSDGSLRFFYDPSQGVYDGIEDTLVGVENDSANTVTSIPLTGGVPIFGFDGDGICGIDPLSDPLNPKPFDPAPPGCPYGGTGYEGPRVSFTVADVFNGSVNFSPGLKKGDSTYFGLEGAIQTKCMAIPGVPALKQADPRWGSKTLADPKLKYTIAKFGCYLTDVVMTLNYYGIKTDPATLNTWLIANHGYDKLGFIIPNAVMQYAASQGLPLSYFTVDKRNDFAVDSVICSTPQLPPMLSVGTAKTPHWVVATGQTVSAGGFDTYTVNDPGNYPSDDTLEPWAFTYHAADIYTPYPLPQSGLYVFVHSPLDIYVTAPNGQRKGVNPVSNTTYDEILGAAYRETALVDDTAPNSGNLTAPTKVLYIPHPADGNYSLIATGTGTGSFEIEIYAYDTDNVLSMTPSLAGEVQKGTVLKYGIHYSAASGSQVSVSILGDLNGDGVVNCADIDIVKESFGRKTGQPGFDPRADVNGDGVVNILDLAFVSRLLPAGTVCH